MSPADGHIAAPRGDTAGADWRDALGKAAIALVVVAVLPRSLVYRLLWPTRLRGAKLVAYVAGNAAVGFALRAWAAPALRRFAEQQARDAELHAG